MIVQKANVVVVGGGVMGCAAAYHLARSGHSVTLLEQFAIGHSLGSSHGPTRMIRIAYETADYVSLGRAAFAGWRDLEAETGETLLIPCGGMDIGSPDAKSMAQIRETYRITGVAFDELDRDEIQHRFPQFSLPDGTFALFQADYSMLAADRCVATLARQAIAHGAVIREGVTVLDIRPSSGGVDIGTSEGKIHADRVVLTAGSWSAPLLRKLGTDLPLVVMQEQLAYFAAAHPENFVPGRFPLVIHRFPGTTSIGSFFPAHGHDGVKVMIDRVGPAVDSNDPDRTIDQSLLERLREYATALVPDLTGDIIDTMSCRYTMTPDEDFVLDRHPEHPQIVIASACSGHGFKFGITIGRILADLATAGAAGYDINRFRLDRPAISGTRSSQK